MHVHMLLYHILCTGKQLCKHKYANDMHMPTGRVHLLSIVLSSSPLSYQLDQMRLDLGYALQLLHFSVVEIRNANHFDLAGCIKVLERGPAFLPRVGTRGRSCVFINLRKCLWVVWSGSSSEGKCCIAWYTLEILLMCLLR